ncbi:malonic semialdehyde reductase [Kwoniella heveanensis BCC8398]|uniref:Malonic semialdehyde reductase n=1 Tax=Kwoniella heveanensis BCC8398 TaxID=1296120 RepID=A0A1B9GRP5_9TREE|nr:malonic semialdehyde reductase [Kwoniella heveanensis BCC8398]
MHSQSPLFDTTRLHGKTAVITGASGGIGAAAAVLFARAGCNVVLLARRQDALGAVAEQCEAAGTGPSSDIRVVSMTFDVTDRQAVDRLPMSLGEAGVQDIDVLINNAGGAIGTEQVGAGMADINTMISINLVSLIHLTQVFVAEMKKRDNGHVINIGSIAGREPYVGGSIYCAVKHAVRAFSTALMKEVVGTGIRVTEVAPGFVETNFSVSRFRGDAEAAAEVYRGMQPCRFKDVAEDILWCAMRPPHVQVAELYVLPTCQASATIIARKEFRVEEPERQAMHTCKLGE